MITSANIFNTLHGYNQKNKEDKYKLLHGLIQDGDVATLRFLLNPVYNYKITTGDDKDTILHSACYTGILETVKLILNNRLVDVNHRDYLGRTPLMMAVLFCQYKIVEFLLSRGADPNIPNINGNLPIDEAIKRKDEKSIEFIQNYNTSLNKSL